VTRLAYGVHDGSVVSCSRIASQLDPNRLRLQVRHQAFLAQLPSSPALLEAAKRQTKVRRVWRVDPDGASFDLRGDAEGAREVFGVDTC
jgi:hypothetical protein